MTDTERDQSDDPWSVADEIDDMIESWDPDAVEQPKVDDEWVNRRMLALRFKLDEQQRIRAMYDDQIAVLESEIERLRARSAEQLEPETDAIEMLTWQLRSYHSAQLADAERRNARKLPTMIQMPHGDLRSQAGGNVTVHFDDEHVDKIVQWLTASGYVDAVRVIEPVPERRLPDRRKLQGLVKLTDSGQIVGIVNADGEPMPHATYQQRDRAFWVELADGRTSKDWQK